MALGGAVRERQPPTRAVLLDVLGTLVALEPPWPRLRRTLAERHGVEVSEQETREALQEEMRFYRAHHLEGADAASLEELRLRCAEVLKAGLPALVGLSSAEVREALLDSLRFVPYPDAAPALAALRAAGVRLGAVSNWDSSLRSTLSGVGLSGSLDVVVVSAEVGAPKPEPAIFETALAGVRCAPEDALYVGDSFETDVEGARAAGIRAVLLDRSAAASHDEDVLTILSLAELPDLVGATA
jgi:putative hydrolase of the HAD superfamily